MAEFNLIDEPWIPCMDLHGRRVEHGIRDALLNAHVLREVCDDSPLVTVALHRLLLAILYRLHNGPRGFRAWVSLYACKAFNSDKVTGYLSEWSDRFDLFADSRPFYQIARLEMKQPVSVTRLATECATGNNATLFDHSSDEEDANWIPAQVAKWLVACQSFALGFGKSGNAKIGGKTETLPYSADAIALRGMNIWLQGANLFDTLMVNLAPTDDSSVPPWELDDAHEYRDRLDGKGRKAVASFGVVDRLTWQSRLVRLLPNGSTSSRMYFGQGRLADKSSGDPMKVYRSSKDEGISPAPLSSGKAAWRDAHSILMIPAANSDERRPECFNLLARARVNGAVSAERQFVTHIVGLASAPNKAGKFLLWRHERMPVPTAILGDIDLIERLGGLLGNAERVARELGFRAWQIAKYYRVAGDREPSEAEKNDIGALVRKIDPRPAYWARLERHFFTLLANLPNDRATASDGWKPDDRQTAGKAWCEHVKSEARWALEESIRSLGTTARAIQAIARVRTDFHDG
ncbi:MAG: type I-E CRISPR-associated protein Cse1/CasA [Chloroflexi bacterium]|nr:type I-E CRISPR-associated protein Cse1/CasA [Chloroflexota bacterium]